MKITDRENGDGCYASIILKANTVLPDELNDFVAGCGETDDGLEFLDVMGTREDLMKFELFVERDMEG